LVEVEEEELFPVTAVEFVFVLSKVEEGMGGGGGCLRV